MEFDFEEELEYISNILLVTGGLDSLWQDLDLFLCDIVARTYVSGNQTSYLMSSIQLNTRYDELYCYNKDALAVIDKYIDDKIAEGLEEYRHVKFAFADRSFDELMTHIK